MTDEQIAVLLFGGPHLDRAMFDDATMQWLVTVYRQQAHSATARLDMETHRADVAEAKLASVTCELEKLKNRMRDLHGDCGAGRDDIN